MSKIDLVNQASAPSTPSAGESTLYFDSASKKLRSKDDSGVVTDYSAAGSSITSLTGEVTATGPGAASSVIDNSAVLGKVLTGLSPSTGALSPTDTILHAFNKLAAKTNMGWFPVATDGDVVISSDTTLVRDMYYNTVTVNPGVTLFTGGFRVLGAVSITNNGTIDRSGNPGIVNAAGAALTAGALGASGAGGAGGTAAGTAGSGVTGLGGSGGAGGLGSGGAGGTAGAVTTTTAANGGVEVLQHARQTLVARDLSNTIIAGGGGGGGGGGDGTAGGGGGSGGGVIVCIAPLITGSGTWRAKGGNGGTPSTGNRGGGAGGGAGVVCFVSENDTSGLATDVTGGIGSSGTGTGVTGNNGSVGRVYRVRV